MDEAAGLLASDELRHFQHHQMMRDIDGGDREHLGDSSDVLRPIGEVSHDFQAFGGRERAEHLGAAIGLELVLGHVPFSFR